MSSSCIFSVLFMIHTFTFVFINLSLPANFIFMIQTIRILIVLAILATFSLASWANQRLFHISRSANRNIVCYDVCLTDGQLNLDTPIHVYWHNNEDHPGMEEELSLIQRKLAYGYKVISTNRNEAQVQLTAYKHRLITVCHHENQWKCKVSINDTECLLTEIYVKANPHNPLKVEYVELRGMSLADGSILVEQIHS